MATYNSSSATSSYPLPHADNPLNVDVGRLITTIEKIDGDVAARLPIASYTAADVLVKVKTVDGAGSGLDADTLDGQHAASFAPASHSHANATTGAAGFMAATDKAKLDGITSATYIATGGIYSSSDKVIGLSNNANIANNPHNFYEVKGSGGAAALAFHRPNAFAGFLGIDNDNQWKVGGWSYGAVSHKIWHAGNDGAGSGLDADKLDGYHAASFALADHVHTGGEVPVVKNVQVSLVHISMAGTQNVAISSVNMTKTMVVLNGFHMGGTTLRSVQAFLTSATNLQISATGAVGDVRFQIVEFY